MLRRKRMCGKHRPPLLHTAVTRVDLRVDDILEVKPYACSPWVERPEVVTCQEKEEAVAVINYYQPGQVDLFTDGSVRNGKAGIRVYAIPCHESISKPVASSEQVDAHLAELMAISAAANWPWDPACVACDENGKDMSANRIRIFSDAQSALQSIRSLRASARQRVAMEIIKKVQLSNVMLY
jgi:ribonuclease HI